MRIIKGKGLEKYLGKEVRIEREGVNGNLKEGSLLGLLCQDKEGFYIKLFKTYWDKSFGLRINKEEFLNEYYRLQNMDLITLTLPRLSPKSRKLFREYSVRI